MRPAVAERHAKSLRVADHGVGAHLAGRNQQRQREEIGGDGDQATRLMGTIDQRTQITGFAVRVRILRQDAKGLTEHVV